MAKIDETKLQSACELLVESVRGFGAAHDLEETPKRIAKFYKEFLTNAPFRFTTFPLQSDEMVIVHDIPFWSLCAHHFLPFFGTATVGYIPINQIVGLSKIPRCVQHYAGRLQNQEQMSQQIASAMEQGLGSNTSGVAVYLEARHSCMEARGIRTHNASTSTACLRGAFRNDPATRAEFFTRMQLGRK